MTSIRSVVLTLGLWMAAAAGPVAAITVPGPAGNAEQGRRQVPDAPAPAAAVPALDLFAARLDAVDLAGGMVTVRGQRVPLHPTLLRVLGKGGEVLGPRSLRAGQAARLALEPQEPATAAIAATAATGASAAKAAPARRIVLIYIDG
jgi:hypothetical protein